MMVPSGSLVEISTAARSWEEISDQEMCVYSGVLLCDHPQEIPLYVKCTLVFKAAVCVLAFSQSIL